jgi:hypothetical protein
MMPMVGLLFAASLYTRRHTLGPVVMRKLRGQMQIADKITHIAKVERIPLRCVDPYLLIQLME